MPEYFFHIAVELSPLPNEPTSQTAPLDLTRAFDTLRPFLNSSKPRASRDPAFDRKHHTPKPKTGDNYQSKSPTLLRDHFVPSALSDHRLDYIHLQCADPRMISNEQTPTGLKGDPVAKGIGTPISGTQTKGRYVAVEQESTGPEWGIVHLYRDATETAGLYKDSPELGPDLWNAGNGVSKSSLCQPNPPPKDDECTTLCILAVPSYLTPADFLAFVGEETRDQVSHFRMIRTARANRYMVLMKFMNGKKAREWQYEWNGRVFNSMEPETCHVVFLKSVEIVPSNLQPTRDNLDPLVDGSSTFPKMSNDPFIGSAHTSKPLAPRTPSLIELPTCPVCLERMDETTGLLTILCQHVFHCTCLEKWSGGGCPVCRYTHDDFSSRIGNYKYKNNTHVSEQEISSKPLECETCLADNSLWQCLICGKVGCGRYEGKHAYQHFEESGHNFSMDLESKRVWDYAADVYVHRIIQEAAKPGEKLVELPGRRREPTALDVDEDIEMAKMENFALEYTHLLTSQLDSQRVYFEDIVQRTADKASEAAKTAENALAECNSFRLQLQRLRLEYDELVQAKVPSLESEKQRVEKRSAKIEDMAKTTNQKYNEEKSLASSLMERIKHLEGTKLVAMQRRIQELEEDNATKELLMEGLREEHRDAMMQISAQRKLREMVERGELDEEDLAGATIEAGPAAKHHGQKKKGKSKPNVTSRSEPQPGNPSTAEQTLQSTDKETNDEDPFTKTLRKALGIGTTTQLGNENEWNEENASEMLADFKKSLIDRGILTEKVAVADTIDQEAADSTSPTKEQEGSSVKKTKKRNRRK